MRTVESGRCVPNHTVRSCGVFGVERGAIEEELHADNPGIIRGRRRDSDGPGDGGAGAGAGEGYRWRDGIRSREGGERPIRADRLVAGGVPGAHAVIVAGLWG